MSVAILSHIRSTNYNHLTELITTRQAMYVEHNTESRSCNRCCSGEAISITYSECVSVVLGIQQAMRVRQVVILGPFGSTKFFRIIS